MGERVWSVEESLVIAAPAAEVYAAVADPRRMVEWSTELFAVRVRGQRFTGFNRKGPLVWFTSCRIAVAEPDAEFAFDVTSFGLPIARWGYRVEAEPAQGGTRITEYWLDHRRTPGWRRTVAELLGLVFTATPAARRAEVNRRGMRVTLQRISESLTGQPA
ncbi:SRPBCC family protein [Streptomyces polyrhachis]|uniref:SRPBCC family protein n=1 Tax=Streptomyces polyrhachis TaxID=1282885 RepID=A0ABW2GFD1_9ACTN